MLGRSPSTEEVHEKYHIRFSGRFITYSLKTQLEIQSLFCQKHFKTQEATQTLF